ncbi:hypothetical protein, partial [Rhodopirellula baltica]
MDPEHGQAIVPYDRASTPDTEYSSIEEDEVPPAQQFVVNNVQNVQHIQNVVHVDDRVQVAALVEHVEQRRVHVEHHVQAVQNRQGEVEAGVHQAFANVAGLREDVGRHFGRVAEAFDNRLEVVNQNRLDDRDYSEGVAQEKVHDLEERVGDEMHGIRGEIDKLVNLMTEHVSNSDDRHHDVCERMNGLSGDVQGIQDRMNVLSGDVQGVQERMHVLSGNVQDIQETAQANKDSLQFEFRTANKQLVHQMGRDRQAAKDELQSSIATLEQRMVDRQMILKSSILESQEKSHERLRKEMLRNQDRMQTKIDKVWEDAWDNKPTPDPKNQDSHPEELWTEDRIMALIKNQIKASYVPPPTTITAFPMQTVRTTTVASPSIPMPPPLIPPMSSGSPSSIHPPSTREGSRTSQIATTTTRLATSSSPIQMPIPMTIPLNVSQPAPQVVLGAGVGIPQAAGVSRPFNPFAALGSYASVGQRNPGSRRHPGGGGGGPEDDGPDDGTGRGGSGHRGSGGPPGGPGGPGDPDGPGDAEDGNNRQARRINGAFRSLKIDAPKAFTGDSKEMASEWIVAITRWLRAQRIPEEDWVLILPAHLGGSAAKWMNVVELRIQQGMRVPWTHWRAFATELQAQFEALAPGEKARIELRNLRQVTSVTEYLRRFHQAIFRIPDMAPSEMYSAFVFGLKEDIRKMVMAQANGDFQTACIMAERLDGIFFMANRQNNSGSGGNRGRGRQNTSSHLNSVTTETSDAPDVVNFVQNSSNGKRDHGRGGGRGGYGRGRGFGGGRGRGRGFNKQDAICILCGKKGHLFRECFKLPAAKAAVTDSKYGVKWKRSRDRTNDTDGVGAGLQTDHTVPVSN